MNRELPEQAPDGLSRTQRWVQAVITDPDGVAAGVRAPWAQAALGPVEAGAIVTRSRHLTAEERLGVYHHAYYARLLACLREEFPVWARAVGDEAFDAFAFGYLQYHPSRSYTLGQLGAGFARYLAETHVTEAGTTDGPPGWEEFVIDLATLEWTYGEVFDGPGAEGEPALDPAALGRVPADRWPAARLLPVPCLRLLELRFPVQQYYAKARHDGAAPIPAAGPTFLAITRDDYTVRSIDLVAAEYTLLQALVSGQTVADALGSLEASETGQREELSSLLEGWFYRWASERLFRTVVLTD